MIIILLIAAIISVSIGDIKDAIVILIIVLLNSIIGFVQEYKAEKAMAALKKISASIATVRREGKNIEIETAEIVPGDIILLETGNLVPADIRLTETHSLKIEESSLTGESLVAEKNTTPLTEKNTALGDRKNMAFKSTIVAYGRGEGIVVATGMNTEIGRIAQLLQEKESQTPLQNRLSDFGKKLSLIIIVICVLLYFVGLLRGEKPIQMLLTAISVAVAAIPEALPTVITIALAIGAKRMVKQNALIRKLHSVETLGSITYICSDKTGTITQNKMTVKDFWQANSTVVIQNFKAEELMLFAMELNHNIISNDKEELKGDPTEIALVEFARKNKLYNPSWKQLKRVNELPFDSARKLMTTIYSFNEKWIVITKGAVENILKCCTSSDIFSINNKVTEFAEQGKRVLAYAIKELNELPQKKDIAEIEANLQFIGLVAMIDPPKSRSQISNSRLLFCWYNTSNHNRRSPNNC